MSNLETKKVPLKILFSRYYWLTKPGIIYGNSMSLIAGFLFASKGHINLTLLLATIIGTSLVIGSACVFNNIADRDFDKFMERTKVRATVSGKISPKNASRYAVALGVLGFSILAYFTYPITVLIGLIGFLVYVVIYTPMKRKTPVATLIGSISGATPIIAGYCTAANRFDTGAFLLFMIMVIWQMPHFYAIAIRRIKEYEAAKIPVLPIIKSIRTTQFRIIGYIAAYFIAIVLLWVYGYAGFFYLFVMIGVSYYWLWLSVLGLKKRDKQEWAKKLFLYSLIVLTVFCVLISINAWLP